jgi:hypothetical protein
MGCQTLNEQKTQGILKIQTWTKNAISFRNLLLEELEKYEPSELSDRTTIIPPL